MASGVRKAAVAGSRLLDKAAERNRQRYTIGPASAI